MTVTRLASCEVSVVTRVMRVTCSEVPSTRRAWEASGRYSCVLTYTPKGAVPDPAFLYEGVEPWGAAEPKPSRLELLGT